MKLQYIILIILHVAITNIYCSVLNYEDCQYEESKIRSLESEIRNLKYNLKRVASSCQGNFHRINLQRLN